MKYSNDDIKIIQGVHWSFEKNIPYNPEKKIPRHLLSQGVIVKGENGYYIPEDMKWRLLHIVDPTFRTII
jgi:hypothetical protein